MIHVESHPNFLCPQVIGVQAFRNSFFRSIHKQPGPSQPKGEQARRNIRLTTKQYDAGSDTNCNEYLVSFDLWRSDTRPYKSTWRSEHKLGQNIWRRISTHSAPFSFWRPFRSASFPWKPVTEPASRPHSTSTWSALVKHDPKAVCSISPDSAWDGQRRRCPLWNRRLAIDHFIR